MLTGNWYYQLLIKRLLYRQMQSAVDQLVRSIQRAIDIQIQHDPQWGEKRKENWNEKERFEKDKRQAEAIDKRRIFWFKSVFPAEVHNRMIMIVIEW